MSDRAILCGAGTPACARRKAPHLSREEHRSPSATRRQECLRHIDTAFATFLRHVPAPRHSLERWHPAGWSAGILPAPSRYHSFLLRFPVPRHPLERWHPAGWSAGILPAPFLANLRSPHPVAFPFPEDPHHA